MEFKDRLKEYREQLGVKTKVEMAEKIGIKRTLYSMLENGKRQPSKNVLEKLLILSNKPEEYWLYGITDEKEFINKREEFKCLKDAIEQLSNIGLLKNTQQEFNPAVEEVLVAAMKADVTHILEKRKLQKNIKKE